MLNDFLCEACIATKRPRCPPDGLTLYQSYHRDIQYHHILVKFKGADAHPDETFIPFPKHLFDGDSLQISGADIAEILNQHTRQYTTVEIYMYSGGCRIHKLDLAEKYNYTCNLYECICHLHDKLHCNRCFSAIVVPVQSPFWRNRC